MTRFPGRAAPLVLASAAIALAVLWLAIGARSPHRHLPASPPVATATDTKPPVMLLTSLPLLFGEGFDLNGRPAPIAERWRGQVTLLPIDSTDPKSLRRAPALIMVQPRAQTAENLVALDRWVRDGGRLLLFADPLLEWHSDLPLGDPARPMPMFADTGLLGHWGLRLDAPDARGNRRGTIAGEPVTVNSPGALVRTGGDCAVTEGGLVARCRLGSGTAIVVADADVLDLAALGANGSGNARATDRLIKELASSDDRRFAQ